MAAAAATKAASSGGGESSMTTSMAEQQRNALQCPATKCKNREVGWWALGNSHKKINNHKQISVVSEKIWPHPCSSSLVSHLIESRPFVPPFELVPAISLQRVSLEANAVPIVGEMARDRLLRHAHLLSAADACGLERRFV